MMPVLTTDASHLMEWWYCPNQPRCPHGSVLHDANDLEDDKLMCCVDGCQCGRERDVDHGKPVS